MEQSEGSSERGRIIALWLYNIIVFHGVVVESQRIALIFAIDCAFVVHTYIGTLHTYFTVSFQAGRAGTWYAAADEILHMVTGRAPSTPARTTKLHSTGYYYMILYIIVRTPFGPLVGATQTTMCRVYCIQCTGLQRINASPFLARVYNIIFGDRCAGETGRRGWLPLHRHCTRTSCPAAIV